jgi:hypothetical protein
VGEGAKRTRMPEVEFAGESLLIVWSFPNIL